MIRFEKTMIISDITKNESTECFVMHCLQLTTNTPSHDTQFDIILGNNALRAQPATDQSVICLKTTNLSAAAATTIYL